jgi:transketolase
VTINHYHYLRPEIVSLLASDDLFAKAEQQPTRYSYAEAILELGKKNPKIVVLDADVSKSIKTNEFADKFPDRSFNFGVAEQNMMAAAAGMATTGLIPFATTYAVFASMRALDMVIANSTIIAPADPATTKLAVWAAAEYEGPVYLSFTRDPVPAIFDLNYPFEIGKAVTVRDGTDATIIALRDLVVQSLIAAEHLAARGLNVRVIDCHTLKPLDVEAVLAAAGETGAIVTAENNVFFGGLGSAVAEVLVENNPIPMKRIGVRDTFAESGPYLDLLDKYGLSAHHIEAAVEDVIARKQG